MTRAIPDEQLSRLSAFIAKRMGLHFPRERWGDLERGINAVACELGIEDGKSCIEWLLSSLPARRRIEILASHLTIGETYFFRDKRIFQVLEDDILPRLIQVRRHSGKRLGIWSAGCSSGEEPYSIAILLDNMIPDIRDWNITILATDINTRFLRKAVDGVYGHWSFRDVRAEIRKSFFNQKEKGRFEILPRIREMVTFSYLNLAEDAHSSLADGANAPDIIFCRNVLMYFVPAMADRVVQNLSGSLADGGFLVVGSSESPNLVCPQFTAVGPPGAVCYKKGSPQRAGACPARPSGKPKAMSGPAPVSAAAPILEPAGARTVPLPEARDYPPASPDPKTDGRIGKTLYQEASTLYEGGHYEAAAEKTEKLLSRNPSDANGLALLARIDANRGMLDRALGWCEKAIRAEKLHAGYHYLMATILQELGQMEAAAASLQRTLYLDPEFILAHVALGNISRKCGRREASVKHLENALCLLRAGPAESSLPESEGIHAERLAEMIHAMLRTEVAE